MGTPLFETETLRTLERSAAVGLAPGTLMQRAGAAAARQIEVQMGSDKRSVLVICGPGNNGGDGYVCAAELARRGFDVCCIAAAEPATEDARAALACWREMGGVVQSQLPGDNMFDAIVDAMFGIGLARPLAGWFQDAARWIERQSATVFALDVPSGLDADRGSWVGGVRGVRADRTITFLGGKPGLFTGEGCDAAGAVSIESLDVDLPYAVTNLIGSADFPEITKPRARNAHKGQFGNLAVVGGGAGMAGAPLLAARAALRFGAGRVYVDCIGAPEFRCDPMQPELMFRSQATIRDLDVRVIGCGLGTDNAARAALQAALAGQSALVIDADALNLIASDAELRAGARAYRAAKVLTPHPLEAARLLAVSAADVQLDRLAAAHRVASAFDATVVLKGAGTLVATTDSRVWINPTGGPALSTAGTGDVLAGMLGALVAQGFDPIEATLAAVWLHGAAADEFGSDVGLVAGEVAPLAMLRLHRLRRSHRSQTA